MIDGNLVEKDIKPSKETSADLEAVMGRSVYTRIYRRVLDDGGFKKADNSAFSYILPIEADPTIAVQAIEDEMNKLRNLEEDIPVTLPPNFEGEKEARAAVQDVIILLQEEGLLTLDLLRASAKYGGPTSVSYIKGQYKHRFRPKSEYYDYLKAEGIPYDHNKYTLPHTGYLRNRHFVLEAGEEGLLFKAKEIRKVTAKMGLSLTDAEIVKLALIEGLGHEYGHVILRGAHSMGIDTLERSRQLGFNRESDVVEQDIEQIHDEHFAEAVSNTALQTYLIKRMGLTSEKAKEFNRAFKEPDYERGESVYALFEYAKEKGYSPSEIAGFSSALLLAVHKKIPEDIYIWRLNDVIAYHTQPYSREQLAELLVPK